MAEGRKSRSKLDLLARLGFVAGIVGLGFAYGVAVGALEIFPYRLLAQAKSAAVSLIKAQTKRETFVFDLAPAPGVTVAANGLASNVADRRSPGLTFIVGFDGEAYGAKLVDAEGSVLHRWTKTFSEVFPEPRHVQYRARDSEVDWHGTWLFPNGDVLFNLTGGHFPYGGGLVKIDKDSNILWSLPRNTHHDIAVADDGTIYVPAHVYLNESPRGLSARIERFYDERILKVSPDGTVLDEIPILAAIRDSDYRGLLSLNYRDDEDISSDREDLEDVFHVNNIDVLSDALAPRFARFESGDYLISIRNINTIAVISHRTKKVIWALTGPFVRQHDPDFTSAGTILVYDNRGHDGPGGRSRLLEIDPATQAIVWSYTGTADRPFYSFSRGKQQRLPNGNILAIEWSPGRVFEVTPDGEIVWEYFNRITTARGEPVTGKVGSVTGARRVTADSLTFLN